MYCTYYIIDLNLLKHNLVKICHEIIYIVEVYDIQARLLLWKWYKLINVFIYMVC